MKIRYVFVALLIIAILVLQGCYITGRPLPDDQVRTLVTGTATKQDLFRLFGAPEAIVGRGEVMTTTSPSYQYRFMRMEYRSSTEPLFLLFPGASDSHKIYFYRYTLFYGYPIFLILYMGENWHTETDRFWALVDERTGIIEDYAFKAYEKDLVFGRPRTHGSTGVAGTQKIQSKEDFR